MAWVHPALGVVGALLTIWVGFLGLRSRQKRPDAPVARKRHRRFSTWAWIAVLVAAVAGPASTLLFRKDLKFAESIHLPVALLVAALMTAGWYTSRQPRAKAALWEWHPYLGIAAMLGAAWALLLGLGILP